MRPHWDEIRAARNTKRSGEQQDKNPAGKKRTVAALESQLSQLAAKQYNMESQIYSLKTEGEALSTGNAKVVGDSFGGRFDNSNNKKHWLLWYMFWTIVCAECKKLGYCFTCIYPNMYDNTPTCRISDITTSSRRISQTKQMISKPT